MFGIANRKQEIKEKEQELAACQAALAKKEHMLGEMSLMWISADQRMLEIERQQRELEQQLKQVMSAACGIAGESEQQVERNQKLLQQVGEIAGKQEELRTGQRKSWKEPGETEDREPIDLTKIVAPITAELSHGMEEMRNMLDEVVELGKQMGVISLNAAVEAGRMGEGGKKFVEAAEEIRGLSGQYQKATSTLAQQMQLVGLKWQKSKGEIDKVEERLKQQYAGLLSARKACTFVGEELLKLPVAELRGEMEKAFADETMKTCCEDISEKIEKASQDFVQQRESWDGLRQTAQQAKALIKEIQGEEG